MENEESVLVFDVDGVLAAYEYGEYNHNACRDEDWNDYLKTNNVYADARPLVTLQKWLSKYGNPERIFVCTNSADESEFKKKADFVTSNYPIKKENILMAKNSLDKLNVIKEIHTLYFPTLDEKKIIMIDDTAKVLTNIQENSGYSTAHISSFIQ